MSPNDATPTPTLATGTAPAPDAAAPSAAPASEVQPASGDAPTRGDRPLENAGGPPAEPAEPAAPDRPPRNRNRRGKRPNREGADASAAAPQAAAGTPGRRAAAPNAARVARPVHPLLEKLAALYPQLFGARFLPLQRGVYEALLARHPDELPADELKVALGLHARSGRYLEAIASRLPRHDLEGAVVEPVAPEHVHHAIVELYRRRQGRTPEDLRPKLIARLAEAIGASGLDRAAYTEQARVSKPEALALIDEAFAEHGRLTARREALQRAFEASGQSSIDTFAEMYGIPLGEARRLLGPGGKD